MGDRIPIYLDHQAHAPLDERVAEMLGSAFSEFDANPHSSHGPGLRARAAVEAARAHVAALVAAEPAEIVFTSGATEANNLALAGLLPWLARGGRRQVLVSEGEHPSVLAAAEALGVPVGRIPLLASGLLDLAALRGLLREEVAVVSVAMANHEIGTIQPVGEISSLVRSAGAVFHSDLAQAAGKLPIEAGQLDLASLSSHKLGGPVGIGALFVRRPLRRHMAPLQHGGGQEGGLRAGTVPAPLCHAFGEAARLALGEMNLEARRVAALRDDLLARLQEVGGVLVNGGYPRLPGNLNVSFERVDGEALVLRLREEVAFSTGSACSSASLEPSHVLAAIGVRGRRAEGAVRFSLGRTTTSQEIIMAAAAITDAVRSLRRTLRRVA